MLRALLPCIVLFATVSCLGPLECDATHKCPSGTYCENNECYARVDCPQIQTPQLRNCKVTLEIDENDCPRPKFDCQSERIRAKRDEPVDPPTNVKCAKNAEYRECTNVCGEKSCENYMAVSACFSLRCGAPACVCKPGHVLVSNSNKSQGCVPRETCRKLEAFKTAKQIADANKPSS